MIIAPVELLERGDVASVRAHIARLLSAGARSLLMLVGEETDFCPKEWDEMLQALPVPVFGGIFPRIVLGLQTHAAGVLVIGLACHADVCIAEGLDEVKQSFEHNASHYATLRQCGTVMIWVDGLARHISALMESVFDVLGAQPCYIGGGVGSLSFSAGACLFSNRGMLQDAALVVGLPTRMVLGVEHGWEPLAGPFIVSEAHGHEIRSLDFRSAAEVYREVVEPLAGLTLTEENFFGIAKNYPFGLERFDGSFVVRDPIILEGDTLICVGDVPSQACLHVLRGEEASLIRAASTGSMQAVQAVQAQGHGVAGALLVDCIGRALFLEDGYGEELVAVNAVLANAGQAHAPIFGALTLGEIANPGDYSLELFNKTFVLGLIPDANV